LLIISAAASESLTEKDCSPYTIAWTWDNYSLLKGLVEPLLADGADTWFYIGPDSVYGRGAAATLRTMIEQRGGKYLGEVFHSSNGSDFASFLLTAQASKAKVIAIADGGADLQNLTKQGRDFGVFPTQRFALLANTITDTHGVGLATMSGTLSVAPFYWDRDDATRALSKRFFERTKAAIGETQSGVYSAVLNYLKAVEATKSLDPDKVIAYLRNNKIEDAFAQHAKLLPNGRLIHDMYLLETKEPNESKYPWHYYKIVKVIPGEAAFRPIAESQCPLVTK
jgi:branched-chain amino acid transport system substrate-binding protein